MNLYVQTDSNDPFHCPRCGAGPGRIDPLYDTTKGTPVATGMFRCEVCQYRWFPQVQHAPAIVIEKVKRLVVTITCPGCNNFEFERTSVGHARAWAQEHNFKSHDQQFQIEDRTVTS